MIEAARVERLENGTLLRIVFERDAGNVLTGALMRQIDLALAENANDPHLRLVTLEGHGKHFSFGASVEEHLPASCGQMLASLHALILTMVEFHAPILVAVRGQCLGGGLEVALAGGPIFAAPDAQFAQPEMKLGVFAPAASVLLPYRVNQPVAEDLLFSGRSISATEGARVGLVHTVSDDPEAAARAWFHEHLEGRSAAALALALAAARGPLRREVRARLAEVETLYLDRLMATRDANEGLVAFLAKRKPHWEHR